VASIDPVATGIVTSLARPGGNITTDGDRGASRAGALRACGGYGGPCRGPP
jgi:hypothetical protein